jgi:hypothetical protein
MDQVIANAALACLGEYSHANNFVKKIMGLYLYATGAQRQTITVLSTLGLAESYSGLTYPVPRTKALSTTEKASNDTVDTEPEEPQASDKVSSPKASGEISGGGTLRQLSSNMRTLARGVATTGLYAVAFDNINIGFRSPEQIVGRHGTKLYILQLQVKDRLLIGLYQILKKTGHVLHYFHCMKHVSRILKLPIFVKLS